MQLKLATRDTFNVTQSINETARWRSYFPLNISKKEIKWKKKCHRLSAGFAAVVLIGIGIVIGLTICNKNRSASTREGLDDFTTPTYIPASRVEPRSHYGTNRKKSQRTSLYLDETRNGTFLIIEYDSFEIQTSHLVVLQINASKEMTQNHYAFSSSY